MALALTARFSGLPKPPTLVGGRSLQFLFIIQYIMQYLLILEFRIQVYLMGLNLSNQQIARELNLNSSDVQKMTTQLREGIVKKSLK